MNMKPNPKQAWQCDTEDWNNDAENSHFKIHIENSYFKL